jgi:hypothetical protein
VNRAPSRVPPRDPRGEVDRDDVASAGARSNPFRETLIEGKEQNPAIFKGRRLGDQGNPPGQKGVAVGDAARWTHGVAVVRASPHHIRRIGGAQERGRAFQIDHPS